MSEKSLSYHDEEVPDGSTFQEMRQQWRSGSANDEDLRAQAVQMQIAMDRYSYTYQFEWLGVPIVRLPDDIMIMQEIIYREQPDCIIETGVARGGSVILSASLQKLCGLAPRVLGIDIDVFPHTWESIRSSPFAESIDILVADSAASATVDYVRRFINSSQKALLILDSDHSHDHVARELALLTPLLPVDSLVLVADTVIEELPPDYFPDRHWSVGDNPLSALNAFLGSQKNFRRETLWGRRAIITEFRDGIVRKLDGPTSTSC